MASNGEDPVTEVRGANGCSRNAVPRHIKPERGQVPENGSPDDPPVKREDVGHVLDHDVPGLQLANDSLELGPQRSLRVSEPRPLTGGADALAGEAADDALDPGEVVGADGSHVIVNRDPREASPKEISSLGLSLDEPCVLVAGLVESGVEKSSAREERADNHRSLDPGNRPGATQNTRVSSS